MMKNTANHWQRILHAPWAQVYVSELHRLAESSNSLCQRAFKDAPPPPSQDSYIRVDADLHADIYRILNHAARIGSLVKDRPRRSTGNQSAGQFEVQQKRVQWMRHLLDGVPVSEVLQSKVRHSLEHYDEFLDETALKSSRGVIATPTLFPMDLVLGREATLAGLVPSGTGIYPLRVYLAEEQVFLNCGRRIHLGTIASECAAIAGRMEALFPRLADPAMKGGSAMLSIKPDTYKDFPDSG